MDNSADRVIIAGDDYPVHQTSHPIAYLSTTDSNFYDRYFFNGYSREGSVFFALALGVYPNLNIMDAAFSVIYEGKQYILRASRVLGDDPMNMQVGPLTLKILEPLKRIHLEITPNGYGIHGDLTFQARGPVLEEPHFFRREGRKVFFDYTRMTQHGCWSGRLSIETETFQLDPQFWWGSRDRSWGIRPVGKQVSSGTPQLQPQFFWLWSPLHFEDCCTHFDVNEEEDGTCWHKTGMLIRLKDQNIDVMDQVKHTIEYQSGTRYAKKANLEFISAQGKHYHIAINPLYNFYMMGLGYLHPTWGHGMYVGDNVTSGEVLQLAEVDQTAPMYLHIQAVCQASLETEGNPRQEGMGIFEMLVIGSHQPSGFKEFLDFAP